MAKGFIVFGLDGFIVILRFFGAYAMNKILPISEADHQKRLQDAKRRRLQVLELQAALYGFLVPPGVIIEIESIREDLSAGVGETIVQKKNVYEYWVNAVFFPVLD